MLEGLALSHQERFNEIRTRYGGDSLQKHDLTLKTAWQATHRIERITYLLDDYALLRLPKKETEA